MLAGWTVFATKGCGACHAVRGIGGTSGPDLGRIPSGASFFDLGAAMWNHLPRMGDRMREARAERMTLTPVEVANLLAFLYTAQYLDESGDARAGERLFTAKGCAQCHAVGGAGGTVGPALDSLKRLNSPVLVAAAMWNHGPRMAEAMKARGIERPTFDGRELLDIVAYIVTTARDTGGNTEQVIPGTPERGKRLFTEKGCVTCHAVGGRGGKVGPDLGRTGHPASLTVFAARMWNHAPAMSGRLKERGPEIPLLSGQDMADLLAYLYDVRYFESSPSPRRGEQVLRDRGCLDCHAVRGKGGKAGADLATSKVVATPASLIAGMWNHGRLMEAQAGKAQKPWPVLTGQDLADVAAYLGSLARGGRSGT
jgi:mono/diheme cytochrome c family protein